MLLFTDMLYLQLVTRKCSIAVSEILLLESAFTLEKKKERSIQKIENVHSLGTNDIFEIWTLSFENEINNRFHENLNLERNVYLFT